MSKKLLLVCALLAAPSAFAQQAMFSDLIKTPEGQRAFSQLTKGEKVPQWLKKGGVETPAQSVTLGETNYQVFTVCEAHNCANQRFAVLYSPKTHTMSGVYSQQKENQPQESLRWMNVGDELSIDGKTVLYAALSGSLANHPEAFNFKK